MRRFRDIQIVFMTNFVVVSSVGIKKVDCSQLLGYSKKVSLYKPKALFVCVEVLRPSQPNVVMSSAVSLPNHTFTGQA